MRRQLVGEVLLPHSRKAARGVITRGVVAVVGGFVVTLQAGGGVVPCLAYRRALLWESLWQTLALACW